jgi:hypothetical protein
MAGADTRSSIAAVVQSDWSNAIVVVATGVVLLAVACSQAPPPTLAGPPPTATEEEPSQYKAAFEANYGYSLTNAYGCAVCHDERLAGRNVYGQDLSLALSTEVDIVRALRRIELVDSDGDGYANIVEIRASSLPGDAASVPRTGTPVLP